MDNHGKISNLGALADAAYGNFRETFTTQAAFAAAISGFFITTVIGLSYLGLAVIWPAVPNFTGNATVTDGIFLSIFAFVIFLVSAFFMVWQSAAAVTVCHEMENEFGALAKSAAKSSLPAFTILLAQFALLLPILAVFGLIIFANLANILTLLPILLTLLFAVIILQRTLGFFALSVARNRGGYFFGPIVQSIKIVVKKGLLKIFILTAFTTMFSLGLFGGVFLLLLNIFGQIPSTLADFLGIVANPTWFFAALLLAYIPVTFFSPKLSVLAHSLYYGESASASGLPGLPSRTLATAMDLVVAAVCFWLFFHGASALFTGGGTNPFQININAAITTVIAFFAVFILYNIYFEVFENGQTPGKRLFALVVLSDRGVTPNFVQSLVRNVLRIVDIFGFILMIFNEKHHRLGDMLSLTTVEYAGEASDHVS